MTGRTMPTRMTAEFSVGRKPAPPAVSLLERVYPTLELTVLAFACYELMKLAVLAGI